MKYFTSIASIIALIITQSCQTTQYVVSKSIEQKHSDLVIKKHKINLCDPIEDYSVRQKVELSSALAQQKAEEFLKTEISKKIITEAESYLGTPYLMGGMSRNGIDCSGFVLRVFNQSVGIELPRIAASQSQQGVYVKKEELESGDLLFFSTTRRGISHVGIVKNRLQDGTIEFIHSASSLGVSVSKLDSSYWRSKYRFAKRILKPIETYSQNKLITF